MCPLVASNVSENPTLQLSRLEGALEMDLEATVCGQRDRRGDGARIREDDAAERRVGRVTRGNEIPKGPVVRVEEVIHETIDLDVIVDVVRRVDVDLGVPAKLFV